MLGGVSPDPVVVTRAGRSGTEDRRLRQRRYMLTQLVRMACFLLAVALPVAVPLKLLFVVGAFVLPWMGVMAANAGPVVEKARPDSVVERQVTEFVPIEPGRTIDHED